MSDWLLRAVEVIQLKFLKLHNTTLLKCSTLNELRSIKEWEKMSFKGYVIILSGKHSVNCFLSICKNQSKLMWHIREGRSSCEPESLCCTCCRLIGRLNGLHAFQLRRVIRLHTVCNRSTSSTGWKLLSPLEIRLIAFGVNIVHFLSASWWEQWTMASF